MDVALRKPSGGVPVSPEVIAKGDVIRLTAPGGEPSDYRVTRKWDPDAYGSVKIEVEPA